MGFSHLGVTFLFMFGRKRHEKHKTNFTSSMIIHQFDRQHDSTTENDLNRSESDPFK